MDGPNLYNLLIGCAEITVDDDGYYHASRFTAEQVKSIEQSPKYAAFARNTAGISLAFRTSGSEFAFECILPKRLSLIRSLLAMLPDVLPRERRSKAEKVQNKRHRINLRAMFGMDDFELVVDGQIKTRVNSSQNLMVFRLDNPLNREVDVQLHFPLLESPAIRYFAASSPVEPLDRPGRRMLCLGDSITQGCYAANPSKTYVNLLAQHLGYEAVNQGISGCTHITRHLDGIESLGQVDHVLLAYGTNDWAYGTSPKAFSDSIAQYYARLSRAFPSIPVTVITPFWRDDMDDAAAAFPFTQIASLIRAQASVYPNFQVICGLDVSPHDTGYYSDQYLHPNNKGFEQIASKLAAIMRKA